MAKPAISILVPICNTEHYLRDCLESLVSQSLQNIEIICIDDGSKDSSPAIIEDFMSKDSRIKVITKPNSGYGDSMNKGLDRASGEYIGIVESDDFVEVDMFQRLYELAKSCDADVAKSNFMYHKSLTDPHTDPIVENLFDCPFDEPFNPLDYQSVFLTQPAIWSAIYRKEFLDAESIRFLPTPGASFQDTGFNFKVLAAAKVAILTKNAYLHYRIDNSGSSVKSQSKIFCVCEEYDEIWRFAQDDPVRFEALKYRIPQIQFGGYQWNIDRLIERLRYEFYERFVSDFKLIEEKGLLKEDYFDAEAWHKVSEMMDDPEAYFRKVYGPVVVDTTFIVRFEDISPSALEKHLMTILGNAKENDEIIFYAVNANSQMEKRMDEVATRDGRLFTSENLFASRVIEQIDDLRIRGNELIVACVSGNDLTGNPLAMMSHAALQRHVSGYDTQGLVNLGLPLLVPLLKTGYYDAFMSKMRLEFREPCNRYFVIPKDALSLEEVTLAQGAFKALSEATKSLFSEKLNPVQSYRVLAMFKPLWESLKQAYNELTYNDRIILGRRPSATSFPAVFFSDDMQSQEDVCVSVIIPVYNVNKYLPECLESVINQHIDLEIICIDDGSTDGSAETLLSYASKDSRIKVISQLNGGAGAARNRGIEAARGKYLAFIDPDDFYPNASALPDLVRCAEDNSALVCGGTLEIVDEGGVPNAEIKAGRSLYLFKEEGVQDFSTYENDYGWIRFIYNRLLFQDMSMRFPETYRYEDPVFFLRVADKARTFFMLPEAVYEYRVDHKNTEWDAPKVRDLLEGIMINIEFADSHGWDDLYSELIRRLDHDYYEAIHSCMDDEEVAGRMAAIQGNLRFDKINFARERGWKFFLLRVFIPEPDLALTRLSKKIEGTRLYAYLQDMRRMAKSLPD